MNQHRFIKDEDLSSISEKEKKTGSLIIPI